jgi:hypothetical protein
MIDHSTPWVTYILHDIGPLLKRKVIFSRFTRQPHRGLIGLMTKTIHQQRVIDNILYSMP